MIYEELTYQYYLRTLPVSLPVEVNKPMSLSLCLAYQHKFSTDLLIKYFEAQLMKPFTELNKRSRTTKITKSYRFAQMFAFWPKNE